MLLEEIHTWKGVFDVIKNDDTINFITYATTPWNALSIDALLLGFNERGIKINGIIVIEEHFSAGYMITPESFTNNCCRYVCLPNMRDKRRVPSVMVSVIQYYKTIFRRTKKANPLYVSTYRSDVPECDIVNNLSFLGRNILVCNTEEGVGQYMGTFDKTYSFSEVKNIGNLRGYVRKIFFGKYVYKLLHPHYDSMTMEKRFGKLYPKKENTALYRKIFEEKNRHANISISKEELSKSIVICTTAWRRNEIQYDEDLRVLKMICDGLHNKGYSLLLKTHPRDKFFETCTETLHCKRLHEEGLSMECLCEYAQPLAVISFSSTTLVNPHIFCNIPTYCLTNMLDRSKISDFYLDEIDGFKKTFGSVVKHVCCVEELKFDDIRG